ncbi:tetratricopeptide repeat protein [bacterium]|nr:tetratricopeptide repeat protein [bacterium]
MIKKIILTFYICCFFSICFALDVENTYRSKLKKLVNLFKAQQIDNAMKTGLELLKFTKKRFGNNHINAAVVNVMLGDVYRKKQQFELAGLYYKRYISIIKSHPEQNIEKLDNGLLKMMRLYAEMGDFQKAYQFAERRYNINRKKYEGKGNSDTIKNLMDMALYKEQQGEYNLARKLYLKCQLNADKLKNNRDLLNAEIYFGLGRVSKKMKNYANAAKYYNKSIIIKTRFSGGSDPAIGNIYKELAQMFIMSSNFNLAETYLKKTLVFQTRKGAGNLSGRSEAMMDLAGLYYITKQYEKCEYQIKNAIVVWEKSVGKYHPKVAYYIEKLGYFYKNIRDFKRSQKYLELAEEIKIALAKNNYKAGNGNGK